VKPKIFLLLSSKRLFPVILKTLQNSSMTYSVSGRNRLKKTVGDILRQKSVFASLLRENKKVPISSWVKDNED
jgi:hypothetical protein